MWRERERERERERLSFSFRRPKERSFSTHLAKTRKNLTRTSNNQSTFVFAQQNFYTVQTLHNRHTHTHTHTDRERERENEFDDSTSSSLERAHCLDVVVLAMRKKTTFL